jgi:single-strand DNA-binding protein
MSALNRVQLIGYLGKDPESRFIPTGKKVTNFSVAVTEHWKAGDESREHTEWVNIEAWERLGEIAEQYLHKGSLVYIEGRLRTDKYEDKGETKYFTKVTALGLQLLDRKGTDEPGMPMPLAIDEEEGEYETE